MDRKAAPPTAIVQREGGRRLGKKARRPEGRLALYARLLKLNGRPSRHEAPHDRDHREHEQQMNQTATHVKNNETEEPKYE
jgi:hypothetical protein